MWPNMGEGVTQGYLDEIFGHARGGYRCNAFFWWGAGCHRPVVSINPLMWKYVYDLVWQGLVDL